MIYNKWQSLNEGLQSKIRIKHSLCFAMIQKRKRILVQLLSRSLVAQLNGGYYGLIFANQK